MKTTISRLLLGACLSVGVGMTQAATITHGNLSYDNTGQIIQDSLNDRNWVDFEGTGLTFSNLVTATQAGGAWEGWNIADNSDAVLFIDALLGGDSTCATTSSYGESCGFLSAWADGSFGSSWSSNFDYFMFADTVGGQDLGILDVSLNAEVRIYNSWSSFGNGDGYVNTTSSNNPINYLIWQSATPAPAPAAGLLMATAAMGLFYRRRKAPASH